MPRDPLSKRDAASDFGQDQSGQAGNRSFGVEQIRVQLCACSRTAAMPQAVVPTA
jgi:hypothetical protein